MKFTDKFYNELLEKAAGAERKRMNYDLRTSAEDSSQRMLNAILPESVVPVHRHRTSSESVACLRGNLTEIFFEEVQNGSSADVVQNGSKLLESARYELSPGDVLQIPKDVWHTVVANCPSVILEAKDGAFEPARTEDVWQ